jgi:hypothetical protein
MATDDQKPDNSTTRELNSQALALAEQLGRIAGTLEGTAEAWLNRASVTEQLTKVRDGATQLLNSLSSGAASGAATVRRVAEQTTGAANATVRRAAQQSIAAPEKSKSGKSSTAPASKRPARRTAAAADPAHAAGKKHRKPAQSVRGAKHSNSMIPKAKASAAVRQRRKSYA